MRDVSSQRRRWFGMAGHPKLVERLTIDLSRPAFSSGKKLVPHPLTRRLRRGHCVHFMGIGGIGMSGLAKICKARGMEVSGCDSSHNSLVRELEALGIPVQVGHSLRHIDEGVGLLVHSAAIPVDQPELHEAMQWGVPTMTRGELLAELAKSQRLISVAGSHGKTTVSAMAAQLLIQAGWDPTVLVGGIVRALKGNARAGSGRYLVAESDESDGSFLLLKPEHAIITNVDREHLNYYETFDRLVRAFEKFVKQVAPTGTLIRCQDDPLVRQLPDHPNQITYGLHPDSDVQAVHIRLQGHHAVFEVDYRGRGLGTFTLSVPGLHNVVNALSVIALGLALDISVTIAREALEGYQGTERRFQVSRLPNNIWLIEDYAHHPVEIEATLDADAGSSRHRIVVFQPHRFSRTKVLEREFIACFDRADGLIVTDIYSAFERPIPGITGERLARLIKAHGHPCVRYVPRQELSDYVHSIANSGDTIFFLGAGDIGEICHDMANRLREPAGAAL